MPIICGANSHVSSDFDSNFEKSAFLVPFQNQIGVVAVRAKEAVLESEITVKTEKQNSSNGANTRVLVREQIVLLMQIVAGLWRNYREDVVRPVFLMICELTTFSNFRELSNRPHEAQPQRLRILRHSVLFTSAFIQVIVKHVQNQVGDACCLLFRIAFWRFFS